SNKVLVSAITCHHNFYRARQQVEIEPGRPVPYIIVIQFDPFAIGGLVPSGYLPQPGESWYYLPVEGERIAIFFDLTVDDRPRPHQAHFAAQDIPQLRQLVQAGLPQNAADPGDSWIVPELMIALPFVPKLRVGRQIARQN